MYHKNTQLISFWTIVLALETKEQPVLVESISPGMVVTSMLTDPVKTNSEINRDALKVFHILADRMETIAPFLVGKMLANKKHGASIKWLNAWKITGRFIKNVFKKRKVAGLPELNRIELRL